MQNLSVCFADSSPIRGALGMSVRTSSVRQSRCTAIGNPFVRAKLSRRLQFFGSVLALSGASRQLSQRESHYTLLASSSTLRFGTQ